jgi:hypothetical protein
MLLPGIGGMVGGIVGGIVGGKVLSFFRGDKGEETAGTSAVTPVGVINVPESGNHSGTTDNSSVTNGYSDSDSNGTSDDYELMRQAYKRYSVLVANGQGDSAEAQQALMTYKEAYARCQNGVSTGK